MRSRLTFFAVGIVLLVAFLPTAGPSQRKKRTQPMDCAGDTWTAISSTNAPDGLGGHTAVWTGNEMIVWGGQVHTSSWSNTGGTYSPATDSWMSTSTTNAPEARRQHTAVWTGSEMIVWGGDGSPGGNDLNTGGRYDPLTNDWTTTGTTAAPAARLGHTAVWTGSQMIIWGGRSNAGYLTTGARYNPTTNNWTATSTTNAPSGRELFTAVWIGTEMIVWGGYNANGSGASFNTGARYNPNTNNWATTTINNAPSPRYAHTTVWTGSEMIIWGGIFQAGSTVQYLDTGGRYNPSTGTWIPTSTTNAPTARGYHTAVWTGNEMIVWGGNGMGGANTGATYNPTTDSWAAISSTNAPTTGGGHTAVWTGNEMIVWGGSGDNTGGRYCAGLVPQSAVSRKTHGAAGVFDIDLPFTSTPGIECRTGGATNDHAIVVTFPENVTVNGNPQAAVTSGAGTVGIEGKPNGGMVLVNGNTVTVPLTNVANAQTINVTLFSVNSVSDAVIPMSVLAGDVNDNGAVNAGDIILTKTQIGQAINQTNFRADVNAGGAINATDVSTVKSYVGTGLP